jgi:hypothetical protein
MSKENSAQSKEMIMSTFIRSALVAAAMLASASAAMAASYSDGSDGYYGQYSNSQDGVRAFWDNMARNGA